MGVEGQKTKRKRKSGEGSQERRKAKRMELRGKKEGSSKIVKSKGKKSNLATNLGDKKTSPVKAVQSPLKTEKKTPADPKAAKSVLKTEKPRINAVQDLSKTTKTNVVAKKAELRNKLTQALLKSRANESRQKTTASTQSEKNEKGKKENPEASTASGLTELQAKMKKKLAGGNFRFINEKLYTTKSDESFKLFKSSPSLFDVYHEGFRSQVELWPSNPVDLFIKELKSRKQSKNSLVIADLGCGEAKLSESLLQSNPKTGTPLFVVHSFDLVAPNERVVACDIRKVPMKDATVDVAIFCLALMGTNFMDFLAEAWRILKPDGELKIAEVTSRFPDVKNFVAALESIGFKLRLKDESNKMFIMFNFVKLSKKKSTVRIENPEELLTPCIYKKR